MLVHNGLASCARTPSTERIETADPPCVLRNGRRPPANSGFTAMYRAQRRAHSLLGQRLRGGDRTSQAAGQCRRRVNQCRNSIAAHSSPPCWAGSPSPAAGPFRLQQQRTRRHLRALHRDRAPCKRHRSWWLDHTAAAVAAGAAGGTGAAVCAAGAGSVYPTAVVNFEVRAPPRPMRPSRMLSGPRVPALRQPPPLQLRVRPVLFRVFLDVHRRERARELLRRSERG